jgi:hypothetical protein
MTISGRNSGQKFTPTARHDFIRHRPKARQHDTQLETSSGNAVCLPARTSETSPADARSRDVRRRRTRGFSPVTCGTPQQPHNTHNSHSTLPLLAATHCACLISLAVDLRKVNKTSWQRYMEQPRECVPLYSRLQMFRWTPEQSVTF